MGEGKWVDMNFSTNKVSLLQLTAPEAFEVDDVAFCTPRDSEARDPVSLRIDGRLDDSDWIILHETGDGFPTPSQRRTWTPWLLLQPQGPAPEILDGPRKDVVRYRCSISNCTDSFARKEGYLVRGKLLAHMLCKHPD